MSDKESQILEELKASILFAEDFPKWSDSSLQHESVGPAPWQLAMALAREQFLHLQMLVRRLGDALYVPAVPALEQLWRECALVPVRDAAGHALFKIGTPEALNALTATIDRPDYLSIFLGIKSVFKSSPSTAYDYFLPRFEVGKLNSRVPSEILRLFAPRGWSNQGPVWEEDAREWLKRDSRWLFLCARLRRDNALGFEARNVLRHAHSLDRTAALASVRREEAKDYFPAPPRVSRIGDLVERYERGEFETVWREIRSYPIINGDFRTEVEEVAEATMRRVARNADMLADRLLDHGWRALFMLDDSLRTKPASDDEEIFRRITEITASPVPPSLLAFWRIVGG